MTLRLRDIVPHAVLFVLVACASKPPPRPEPESLLPIASVDAAAPPAPAPKPVVASSRVRWEPTEWVSWEGAKGFIASGRRVVRDSAGDHVIPSDPPFEEVLQLPATLGRGYVFFGPINVYAAERFDGPLNPVVERTDRASRMFVGLGFGSIFLEYSGASLEAHELPSGRSIPIDPPNASRVLGHPAGFVVAAAKGSYLYAEAPGQWKPLGLKTADASHGDIYWHPAEGILVDTPKGYVGVGPGGRTKPSARKASREFFTEVSERGAFVARAAKELEAVGEGTAGHELWDVRLEGEVTALKHATCTGRKSKPNALCLERSGKWIEGWLPDTKVDWDVAIWASKDDQLLGLIGNNQACVLVAPLERKHVALPCPGFMVSAEAHARGSITGAGALRVVTGGMSGIGITEVSLDGTAVEAPVPPHIQSSMAGRRGLLVLADHTMLETNDDGRSWLKVASPPFGAAQLKLKSGDTRGWLSRCSETGCRFYDGMRRVGWELP